MNVLGHQGFVLNRYLVYEVSSDVGSHMSTEMRVANVIFFSAGLLFLGDIPSLCSFGTYWSSATRSVYYRRYRLSG